MTEQIRRTTKIDPARLAALDDTLARLLGQPQPASAPAPEPEYDFAPQYVRTPYARTTPAYNRTAAYERPAYSPTPSYESASQYGYAPQYGRAPQYDYAIQEEAAPQYDDSQAQYEDDVPDDYPIEDDYPTQDDYPIQDDSEPDDGNDEPHDDVQGQECRIPEDTPAPDEPSPARVRRRDRPAPDDAPDDEEPLDGVAVSVHDLRVSYGAVQAVRGVSFDVAEGSFFSFLGANGAGKSSTINCLTTLLRPAGGKAIVAGHRLGSEDAEIRHHIGVVFQGALLDPLLTVRENLALRAQLQSIPRDRCRDRIKELTELLKLENFIDREYRTLSGGQKRRSDIARALLHQPSVLFLDEPTAGLDPHSREQVWQTISSVREHEGMTVFLTTHYMEETERADLVCVIDHGLIAAMGTPAALRQQYSTSQLSLWLRDERQAVELLADVAPTIDVSQPHAEGDPLRLPVPSTLDAQQILAWLWDDIEDFEFRHGSMDDVFLALTRGTEAVAEDDAVDDRAARARSRYSWRSR